MIKIIQKTLLGTIFTLFLLFSLCAQDQSYYENWEKGFALYYPADWFKEDLYDSVSFCSSENSFDFNSDRGAGLVIMTEDVSEYGIQNAQEALEEQLSDYDELGEFSLKTVSGEEWVYVDTYQQEDNFYAEFYAIIRHGFVYIIGIAYYPPEIRESYEEQIGLMLESFEFLESVSGQRHFESQELGVSFFYPANWQLEESTNQVEVVSSKNFSDIKGIGFAFMKGHAEDLGISDSEEVNENIIKDELAEMFQLQEAIKITWLGKEWLYCDGYDPSLNMKAVFYILVESDFVYMIIIGIHPPDVEDEYREGLDMIMESLSIKDFAQ